MDELFTAFGFIFIIVVLYAIKTVRRDVSRSIRRGLKEKPRTRPQPTTPKPMVREETPYAQNQRQAQRATHTPIHPQVITGKCYVIDGDTIVIKKTHIRLFAIDAPELNHPYGIKSKWAMIHLCKGHVIRAEVTGEMSHNRVVAKCYLPDGRDLSEELVKEGLAIDWPKFSGGIYKKHEPPGVRRKLWRAAARQRGKMPAD
jgi:endonuclease YncB( thermonuclease family)